jgi:superkiller protein 3
LEKPAEATPAPGIEDKKLGIESYNKEDYDKAIERLNAAANLRPADADIFYYLGDSYSAKKQYKEAIVKYEKAMQIAPQQATEEHYFNVGYAYEVTQDNSNAFQYYQKALGKKSDNPETLTHLGDVSSKLNDWKNAIDAYERAFSLNPKIDDPEVFFNWGLAYVNSSSQYDKAAPKFEKAVELKIDNISEAYFQLGRAYKSTGRFREAVDNYQKQLEKKADDDHAFWAYSDLGEIYSSNLPNKEAALEASKGAVRVKSRNHEAWVNLGVAWNNLGKNQEAAESYNQAVLLEPNNAEYRLRLGNSYWRLQRYSEAIETLNKAVELNPKLGEAYYYRGLAYKGREQYDQAVESLSKGIEIGFGKRTMEGNARYILAVSYFKLGNATASRQQCDFLRTMGQDAPPDSSGVCR